MPFNHPCLLYRKHVQSHFHCGSQPFGRVVTAPPLQEVLPTVSGEEWRWELLFRDVGFKLRARAPHVVDASLGSKTLVVELLGDLTLSESISCLDRTGSEHRQQI